MWYVRLSCAAVGSVVLEIDVLIGLKDLMWAGTVRTWVLVFNFFTSIIHRVVKNHDFFKKIKKIIFFLFKSIFVI